MGSANSVNVARSEDENPSLNQRESSFNTRDKEESKTLVEDYVSIAESKQEDPSPKQEESSVISGDVDEESKTQTQDSKEDEDSEECSFCTYIKGGECKKPWIELEKCLDEAKKNNGESVTRCKEARTTFKTCLYDNPVYYKPVIAAETHMVAKMLSDLQDKKEAVLLDKAQVVAKMLSELQAEKEAILSGDAASVVNALNKLKKEEERIDVLPAEAAAIAKRFSELEEKKKKDKEEKEKEAN